MNRGVGFRLAPFPGHAVTESLLFDGSYREEMFWGTYRPGFYCGKLEPSLKCRGLCLLRLVCLQLSLQPMLGV
jgi:hypothetical protein